MDEEELDGEEVEGFDVVEGVVVEGVDVVAEGVEAVAEGVEVVAEGVEVVAEGIEVVVLLFEGVLLYIGVLYASLLPPPLFFALFTETGTIIAAATATAAKLLAIASFFLFTGFFTAGTACCAKAVGCSGTV